MSPLPPHPEHSNDYEFTEVQNTEFRDAAYWMSIMGRLGIAFGLLSCLTVIAYKLEGLIAGVVAVIGIVLIASRMRVRSVSPASP